MVVITRVAVLISTLAGLGLVQSGKALEIAMDKAAACAGSIRLSNYSATCATASSPPAPSPGGCHMPRAGRTRAPAPPARA